jgi:hypothetical protein
MSHFDSAANIINDAAVELGLRSSDLADPFDSTDPNVVLLCRLLNRLGEELIRDYVWNAFLFTNTFVTVPGQADYNTRGESVRIIDGTFWNRTQQRPMVGPLTPQQWAQLNATLVSSTYAQFYRLADRTGTDGGPFIVLYPTPTAAETLAYEYTDNNWVDTSGGGQDTFGSRATDGTDSPLFDRRMLVAGVKLYFKQAKGFDSSAEQRAFEDSLARARTNERPAQTLSLNGAPGIFRMLNSLNVPDTGYGT